MGSKPSSNLKRDRPESGGADHGSAHETSGLTERDKNKFAAAEQERVQEFGRAERKRADVESVEHSTDETPAEGKDLH
ncbi:MAG: hypothetical protein NVS4B3_06420 [Gemmatimonadaceae bacterium]